MSNNAFTYAVLLPAVAAAAAAAAAQQQPALTEVREMTQRLRVLGDRGAPPFGERAEIVAAVRDRVREHIEVALNARGGTRLSARVAALREQLAEAQSASQAWYDAIGKPFVHYTEGPPGPTVLASFVALDGHIDVPQSKPWIWAFRQRNGKFAAVDGAGSDFAGCGLFLQDIPAGRSGETWLLAWGTVFGANQTPRRMRVYSFDGEKFATIWSPPNLLQGAAPLKDGMIEVSYLDRVQHYQLREPPLYRYDRYALTVQGVVETQSVLGDGFPDDP